MHIFKTELPAGVVINHEKKRKSVGFYWSAQSYNHAYMQQVSQVCTS